MKRVMEFMLFVAMLTPAIASAEGESPHSFSANVAVSTEYVFRGLTQSNEGLALSGGFDYEYTPWGFYAGFWAGSIEFPGLSATNPAEVETNFYGGFTGEFAGTGIGWDVGTLFYYYPDHDEDCCGAGEYDYIEFYGNLSYTFAGAWEPTLSAGFDWSPDYFGEDGTGINIDSSLDLSLPHGFAFSGGVHYLDVDGDLTFPSGYDYVYWSVGVSKELGIFGFDVTYNGAGDDCEDVLAGGNDDLCEAFVFTISSSWD